jgi:hypothetical protein
MMKQLVLSLCIGLMFGIGAASAETKAAPKAEKAAPKERTAKSLECSKEADTKNLHGKPRKAFMRECKKGKG